MLRRHRKHIGPPHRGYYQKANEKCISYAEPDRIGFGSSKAGLNRGVKDGEAQCELNESKKEKTTERNGSAGQRLANAIAAWVSMMSAIKHEDTKEVNILNADDGNVANQRIRIKAKNLSTV